MNTIDTINGMLCDFSTINLDELNSANLIDRYDAKYAVRENMVKDILCELKSDFDVLEIENCRLFAYETVYFDTLDFELFLMHHNRRKKRFKVRYRKYVETNAYFLEVKAKEYSKTKKLRYERKVLCRSLSDTDSEALFDDLHYEKALHEVLTTNFRRITLLSKDKSQKITVDLKIRFDGNGNRVWFNDLSIIEVKTSGRNPDGGIIGILRKMRIKKIPLSKYCLGMLLTRDGIKYNNFKRTLIKLKRLSDGFPAILGNDARRFVGQYDSVIFN